MLSNALHERKSARKPTCEVDDARVHEVRELAHAALEIPAPVAVAAEDERHASNELADLLVLEVRAGPRTERRNALPLQRLEVRPAQVAADAVQEQRDLAVVLDDFAVIEELDEACEPTGLVAPLFAPDAEDRRVIRMLSAGIRLDRFRKPVGPSARRAPVPAPHEAVVCRDDPRMGPVVDREGNAPAAGERVGELEDVADGRAAKSVEALGLVADDAEVSCGRREARQQPLLDVIRVLVLVHQDVADALEEPVGSFVRRAQLVEDLLQVREVDPVRVEQRALVRLVLARELLQERVGRGRRDARLDQLLGHLVEVLANLRNRAPLAGPAAEEASVLLLADDGREVLEHEQLLRQVVEHLAVVPEPRPVAAALGEVVADPVDRADDELGEVDVAADLLRRGADAVAEFERGLFGEGA